ncbi:NAD(P)/FAD-dependent oxidoreductase [Rubripirellula tenax]|nr:NAD(P)/FAD-dependent oxidoreductase [Rubripirellula tenax]
MPTTASEASILVIGGGIAGSACAIRLRQQGIAVDLVEKESFPRPKVCGCCIGVTGLAMLDRLGLKQFAKDRGVSTDRWCASMGGRRIEVPLPTGLAISRESLDPMLIEHAAAVGVNVAMRCEATVASVHKDRVDVRRNIAGSGDHQQSYSIVVVAAGLRAGGISRELPWTAAPHGPFGISFLADVRDVESGVIYMACDDDGYVGLVKLADGRIDVAAALRSGAASNGIAPVERVRRLLERSEFDFSSIENASTAMTTPPLRRSRRVGNGRLMAIGDAAGYIEPFTGEGMTWALQSGVAAADVIAEHIHQPASVGDAWQTRCLTLLAAEKRTCRWVTSALRWPLARIVAAGSLAMFPGLASPLVRGLNRSPS